MRGPPAARRQLRAARAIRQCLALAVALVVTSLGAARAAEPSAALVEQKIRLLESYFDSATARRIIDGGDARAIADLSRGRGLIVDSRDALSAGNVPQANTLADDALRAFSTASRSSAQPARSSQRERTRYDELRNAIGSFRSNLESTLDARSANVGQVLDIVTLDAEISRAETLARDGYFERANTVLAQVYQSAMQAIAAARGNETVVYRLEFKTPADELAYEHERFRGNEMLADMLRGGGASDGARRLADRFVLQARSRRDEARAIAERGDIPGAIVAMEDASGLLARALSALGMSMGR